MDCFEFYWVLLRLRMSAVCMRLTQWFMMSEQCASEALTFKSSMATIGNDRRSISASRTNSLGLQLRMTYFEWLRLLYLIYLPQPRLLNNLNYCNFSPFSSLRLPGHKSSIWPRIMVFLQIARRNSPWSDLISTLNVTHL